MKEMFHYILLILSFVGIIVAQNNYSLEDLNSTSPTFGIEVGPAYFENQITIHYFGHYN